MSNVALYTTRHRLYLRWLSRCPSRHAGSLALNRHRASLQLLPQCQTQRRAAKTRATFKLNELPQQESDAGRDALEDEDVGPAYPTVVLQARNNMRKYENCVLLTRVGSFYELYFDQADKYGPLLNLKVAQKKTAAGPVSMVRYSRISGTQYRTTF
jgi:hypothetical protein